MYIYMASSWVRWGGANGLLSRPIKMKKENTLTFLIFNIFSFSQRQNDYLGEIFSNPMSFCDFDFFKIFKIG